MPTVAQQNSSVRRAGQKGSAIVEAALIFLPFFALILAIIDFSVAIFIKNTLYLATREGCRYAITGQVEPGMGHDASIRSVVKRYSMGFLNGEDADAMIHIEYYDPRTLAAVSGNGSNRGGNIVEVSVQDFPWLWMAPLMRATGAMHFSAASSDVMEPSPGGVPPNR
ncbi:MAG: TadE/TadG family type IV pilus assembly protein [Bryobacteraceae bacterium]